MRVCVCLRGGKGSRRTDSWREGAVLFDDVTVSEVGPVDRPTRHSRSLSFAYFEYPVHNRGHAPPSLARVYTRDCLIVEYPVHDDCSCIRYSLGRHESTPS